MEPITLKSAEPQVSACGKYLNPGILIDPGFIKWSMLWRKPWATANDPIESVECHYLTNKEGQMTRPFQNKIWNPLPMELEYANGHKSWGILANNNDETQSIELFLASSKDEAYFTCQTFLEESIRAALKAML